MTLLIAGLALWWAAHLFPVLMPDRRQAFSARIGLGPSKGLSALVILGSVVLMVMGYQGADTTFLWAAPEVVWHLNTVLMVLAIFLFIAGSFPSVVRRRIRHPQLAGTKLWAVAHLLVNGDTASIVLFGGLLAWAVVAMIGANRRDGPRKARPEATLIGLMQHIAATLVVTVVVIALHTMAGVVPYLG